MLILKFIDDKRFISIVKNSRVLIMIFMVLLCIFQMQGCTTINTLVKFSNGNEYLMKEEYDKASIEYEKALVSNKGSSPMLEMAILTNLGFSYAVTDQFEKAEYAYNKSIKSAPDRGYYGYLNLAEIYYKKGDVVNAFSYITKAKELVNTPKYYELEKKSVYGVELIRSVVLGEYDFLEMRVMYADMINEYETGNNNNAIKLAEKILSKKHKQVYIGFGLGYGNNIITEVKPGSIGDLNGFVNGDKLLEVDGVPTSDMTELFKVANKLLNSYGETSRVKIERKGRKYDVAVQLIYPEIEKTQSLLEELRANYSANNRKKSNNSELPFVKILEPKSARGIKIIGNQNANFVILASGKNKITTVTVNNSKCTVSEANLLEKTILPGNVNKYTVSLPLVQGRNRYVVKAVDIKGGTTQQQIEIEGNETRNRELDKIYDHKVAVVIGINKYNPWPGLEYAVNDAESVRNKLRKMGYDKIIELYNRQATRAAILRVLGDDLLTQLGPNDSLLVYFAGHGQTELLADGQEEGYIIPVDGTMDNYRGTAISMTYIHSMIKKYRAKHVLFAFDSCYSGLGLKRGGGQKKPIDAFIKNMSQKKVRQILTAGGKNEQAAEEKGHGVFTKAFLDSLEFQNSGINKDGYTLASDLGQFVRKQVGEKTQFKQTPMFGWLDGEGDFIFDLNQSSNDIYVAADTTPNVENTVFPAKSDTITKKKKKSKKATK